MAIFNESDNVCYVNLTLATVGRVEFPMAPPSCGRSADPRSASRRVPPDCCLELFVPALSAPRWPGRLRFRVLDAVYGFLASMQRGPSGRSTRRTRRPASAERRRSNRFRAGATSSRRTAGSGGYFLAAQVPEDGLERVDDLVARRAALVEAQLQVERLGRRPEGEDVVLRPARPSAWRPPRAAAGGSRRPGWRSSRSGRSFSRAYPA